MLLEVNTVSDWLLPNRCLVCANDVGQGTLCLSCRSFCNLYPNKILDDHSIAIFWFELTIKELIKNAKFKRDILHMHVLHKLLEEEVKTDLLESIKKFAPLAIAFVPNHWVHRIIRCTELPAFFAHFLSVKLNIPVISVLEKTSFLRRQALQKSKSARQEAIKGAFRLKKNFRGVSRILLVDDIVTTGATFNEIKKLFGNTQIHCIAIAKTP